MKTALLKRIEQIEEELKRDKNVEVIIVDRETSQELKAHRPAGATIRVVFSL